MNAKVTHICPIPACAFRLDEHLPVMPKRLDVDVIREFTAEMQRRRDETHAALNAHLESHFMPVQPVDSSGVLTIDALTDDDAQPAFGLGEEVSLLLLLRADEIAQIIGRPDLDMHAVSHALIECAQSLHVQALGKRVAVFCAERPDTDPAGSVALT